MEKSLSLCLSYQLYVMLWPENTVCLWQQGQSSSCCELAGIMWLDFEQNVAYSHIFIASHYCVFVITVFDIIYIEKNCKV